MIIGCPEIVMVTADAGQDSAIVTWTEPRATDDSGVTPSQSKTHEPGSSFTVGTTTTVTYVFSDASGNRANCIFDVIVSRE